MHLLKKELEKTTREKEELQNRCAELEGKPKNDIGGLTQSHDTYAMDQLANAFISKAKNLKNIDEETKQSIQRFVTENFSHIVEPLYAKIKELEAKNKALREKLQERVNLL